MDGGANVCCCHVTGRGEEHQQRRRPHPADLPGKDQGGHVGTATDIQRDVPSNTVRGVHRDRPQAACKDLALSQIDADKQVRVLGLWEYPK